MRGKRLSERTMGHAKLGMLIDYYLADMQRRGCTDDPSVQPDAPSRGLPGRSPPSLPASHPWT